MKKLISIVLVAVILSIPVMGCGGGLTAQDGDRIKVHYTGKLTDGTTFDSSIGGDPLEFTMGAGRLIPGFENAVRGMKVGGVKTVKIPADEAYGQPREELIFEVQIEQLPEDIDPKIGDQLQLVTNDGQVVVGMVTAVTDTAITVDANHSLAGRDLIFEIEVVEINR